MTDSNSGSTSDIKVVSKFATILLIISLLGVIVGVMGGVSDKTRSSDVDKKADSSVAAIFSPKKDHIMLVDLSGPIMMDSGDNSGGLFASETNAVEARKDLDAALKDDKVKGVLIRINSPGGTVGMSQELNEAVKRVREKKPVVASFGDTAASGGYYTAVAADKIVTNPGTLTASIGVIISTMNLTNLLENKLGVKAITFKSGKFKDILSPYRPPTQADRELVQDIIDTSYQDFLNAVIEGRTKHVEDAGEKAALIERLTAVADGRVVNGSEAVKVGLADQIGDYDAAYTLIDKMAKDRFGLSGKDRLPIGNHDSSFDVMSFLGLPSLKLNMPIRANAPMDPMTAATQAMMPFSMRYPNQPLWIME